MNIEQTWLTVKELAKYIKCSESHIYHLVSAGEIPFAKKGRLKFYVPDIDKWMLDEKDYYSLKNVR